jgi:hypothetical protein
MLSLILNTGPVSPIYFLKLLASPELSDYQITFHQARDDSYIMQNIYPLLKKSERRVRAEHTDTCYYIELDQKGDFQDFIKQIKIKRKAPVQADVAGPWNRE